MRPIYLNKLYLPFNNVYESKFFFNVLKEIRNIELEKRVYFYDEFKEYLILANLKGFHLKLDIYNLNYKTFPIYWKYYRKNIYNKIEFYINKLLEFKYQYNYDELTKKIIKNYLKQYFNYSSSSYIGEIDKLVFYKFLNIFQIILEIGFKNNLIFGMTIILPFYKSKIYKRLLCNYKIIKNFSDAKYIKKIENKFNDKISKNKKKLNVNPEKLYIFIPNIYEETLYKNILNLINFILYIKNKDILNILSNKRYLEILFNLSGFTCKLNYNNLNYNNFLIYWKLLKDDIIKNYEFFKNRLFNVKNDFSNYELDLINEKFKQFLIYPDPFKIRGIGNKKIKELFKIFKNILNIGYKNKIFFPISLIFPFYKFNIFKNLLTDYEIIKNFKFKLDKKNYEFISKKMFINSGEFYKINSDFSNCIKFMISNYKSLDDIKFIKFSKIFYELLNYIIINIFKKKIKEKIKLFILYRYKNYRQKNTYEIIGNYLNVSRQRIEQIVRKIRIEVKDIILMHSQLIFKLYQLISKELIINNNDEYKYFKNYLKIIINDFDLNKLKNFIDFDYEREKIFNILLKKKKYLPITLNKLNQILENNNIEKIKIDEIEILKPKYLIYRNKDDKYYIFRNGKEGKIISYLFKYNNYMVDIRQIEKETKISIKNLKNIIRRSKKILEFKNNKYKFNWKYWNCINTSPYKYYYEIYNYKNNKTTRLYLDEFEDIIKSSMINLNILNMPYIGFYKFVNDVLKKKFNSSLIYEYDYHTFCNELIKISNCFEYNPKKRIALNVSINEISYLQNRKYWIRKFFCELKGAATYKDLLEYLERHYQLTEIKDIYFSDEIVKASVKKYDLSNLIIFISNNFNTKDIDFNLISENLKKALELKKKRNKINLNELNGDLLWIKEYFNKKNII